MKNSIGVLLIAILGTFIYIQPSLAQSKDKLANKILKEVTDKTKSYNSILMDFTYQMENPGANIDEITTGTALVSGEKYRLEVAGQLVISNGETIWTVIEDAEEVQVNEVFEDDESFSPVKMLSDYSKDYKSKLVKKVDELNGIKVYLVELTPIQKKSFKKVNLFINKEKMQPYKIEIFDFNNNLFTYTLTSFIPDVEISDTDFSFSENEFPDFDIIDMR